MARVLNSGDQLQRLADSHFIRPALGQRLNSPISAAKHSEHDWASVCADGRVDAGPLKCLQSSFTQTTTERDGQPHEPIDVNSLHLEAVRTEELLLLISLSLGLPTTIKLEQCLYVGNFSMRGTPEDLRLLLSIYGNLIHADTLIKDKNFRFQNAIAIFDEPVSIPPADSKKKAMVVSHRKIKIARLSQRRKCSVLLAIMYKKMRTNCSGGLTQCQWLGASDCNCKSAPTQERSIESSHNEMVVYGRNDKTRNLPTTNRTVCVCFQPKSTIMIDSKQPRVNPKYRGSRYDSASVAPTVVQLSGLPQLHALDYWLLEDLQALGHEESSGFLSPIFLDKVELNHKSNNIRVNYQH